MNLLTVVTIVVGSGAFGILFGMLYGVSGCTSLREFFMEIKLRFAKALEDMKEEKNFLKEHPYCYDCQALQREKKARYVYKDSLNMRYPLCENHFCARMEKQTKEKEINYL